MFYHASSISGLQILVPYTSGHTKALVYFSEKMENTLVYLSNPVERYCKEIGYEHSGRYYRFMSYRFTKDNILEILEYWPNALEETYMGVSGYIYGVMQIPNAQMIEMPYVIASETPISIESYEYIPDAYLAIMQAEKEKKISESIFFQFFDERFLFLFPFFFQSLVESVIFFLF